MVVIKCTTQPEQTSDCVSVRAAIVLTTAEPCPLLYIVIRSAERQSEQEEEAKKTFSELIYKQSKLQ